MKHFKLTTETKINAFGIKLFRIEATIDITSKRIKKGTKGGWVEKESNLSGSAWVSGSAEVYGEARVSGSAGVYGEARVYGSVEVYGEARVSGSAMVYGEARVYGSAWVYGSAEVYGSAMVYGEAEVYGEAKVFGEAEVSGEARVSGKSKCTSLAVNIIGACKWLVTGVDNHVAIGCEVKTYIQWRKWFKSKEEFDTKRGTTEFEMIKKCFELVDAKKNGKYEKLADTPTLAEFTGKVNEEAKELYPVVDMNIHLFERNAHIKARLMGFEERG